MNEAERLLLDNIIKYRETILNRIIGKIYALFPDSPVVDQSEIESGYEGGLRAALKAIEKLKEQGK